MAEVMANLTKEDYDELLKSLRIKLPEGVLNQEVIDLAQKETIIKEAKEFSRECQGKELKEIPRVPSNDIKRYLKFMNQGQFMAIMEHVFFKESTKQWPQVLRGGFKLRKSSPATPTLMYYSQPQEALGGAPNREIEEVMLNFILKEEKLTRPTVTPQYKAECGFLCGIMDFFVFTEKSTGVEQYIVECKSTSGDMEKKVLKQKVDGTTDIRVGHKYIFQVQAYMYLQNEKAKKENLPETKRAAMIILHKIRNDFWWKYIDIDREVQKKLEDLKNLCQTEVLARYLAVLNLCFEKSAASS